MGAPIGDAINTAHFGVTRARYDQLVSELKADKDISNIEVDGDSGHCSTHGVDFAWEFKASDTDVAAVEPLLITITGRHGFIVSHMPYDAIFDKLSKEFLN